MPDVGEASKVFALISNWFGFICSCLSGVTFAFRVFGSEAKLRWCSSFFSDGCNRPRFREALFSFMPSVFVDTWTPFVFCFVGIFLHLRNDTFKVKLLLKNWIVFFIFHFCMTFFGNFGYANGIGIIMGAIGCLGNLFQFVTIFIGDNYSPGLDLSVKCEIKCRKSGKGEDMLATVTSWIGFVAACCTLTVGLARIIASEAKLNWCDNFISDSCNKGHWRERLFSFTPDVLFDVWTPTIMGTLGVLWHFKKAPEKALWFVQDWLRFFMYNFVMGLFGCMGYANGWGIMMSVVCYIAAILSLVCFFLCEKKPPLDLSMDCKASIKNNG